MPKLSNIIRAAKYTIASDILYIAVKYTPFFNNKDTPPEFINFAGSGNFKAIGDETVRVLEEKAALSQGAAVLEIGCGIARNATALLRKYRSKVHYDGFDVVKFGIEWSRKYFSKALGKSECPYNFYHSDIYNSFYNPRGSIKAREYHFPYDNDCFDIVFATSVFTHMQPDDFYQFLSEGLRVMRPGGKFVFTAFLWDANARNSINKGRARFSFQSPTKGGRLESKIEPDLAVAHDRENLLDFLDNGTISSIEICEGSWRGEPGLSFQDYVIITKADN